MYGGNDFVGCVSVEIFPIGKKIEVTCFPICKPLEVTCFPICSLNRDAYLRVVPDVVWLTPDMLSGEFDIYSNVVWRID